MPAEDDGRRPDRAAWGYPSSGESRWPAFLTVVAALVLYAVIPKELTGWTRWVVPGLELALLAPLVLGNPTRLTRESRDLRWLSLALVALIGVANILAMVLLVRHLLGNRAPTGGPLIGAGIEIWATNVLVFAIWFWEVDRGGPLARMQTEHRAPDFLFPQMANPDAAPPFWTPRYVDYLYTSVTNATAFSPTDVMPLTPTAKLLMMVQSLAALTTVGIVVARAINVLTA